MTASVFDKIRAAKKRLEYPTVGECRVCGKPYARGNKESGRGGMCDIHYRVSNDAVKKGETTWEALHDKFPMTTGRGAVTSTRARYAPPAEGQKLLESEFQNSVVDFIIRRGHGVWVLDPSRKRGVPDLLIITDDGRVLFRELKASDGIIEERQGVMIKRLRDYGQNVKTWRPSDLDSDRVESELKGE